jgi:hypothetical protein
VNEIEVGTARFRSRPLVFVDTLFEQTIVLAYQTTTLRVGSVLSGDDLCTTVRCADVK